MNEELIKKILHIITLAVLAVIFGGGLLAVYPSWQRGKLLRRQDAELTRQIEKKRADIAKLCEYQRRFKSDSDFVELIARRNRRVYPGEIVFLFDD